ncbi:protein-tyrosine-phosphatase [Gammaproteobacteria bacterium ESL0073]|nr:protein-tyrosine-phosphatase [Gammaproteobacteria bacterium ESL0073]
MKHELVLYRFEPSMKTLKYMPFLLSLILFSLAHSVSASELEKDWATPIDTRFKFYQVSPLLFRSALPNSTDVDLIKQQNIGTIISFIKEDDKKWLGKSSGIQLLSYPSHADRIDDDDVLDVLKVIQNSKSQGKSVLIHCKHGQNRTGLFVAMYRIIVQNWTKQQAIDELVNGISATQTDDVKDAIAYIQKAKVKKIRKALQQNSCSTSKYALCQWFS